MLYITVCVLALLAATGVNGRYLYESTIHGSIEANKIVSTWEDALAQCKSEGAVLAAPIREQLRREMIELISVNNHSTPYFINAKIVHSHKLQFVSSEGVSLDDMSVSDMIDELDPREGDCLAMDANSIRVVSCSTPLPYMCYKESDTIATTTDIIIESTITDRYTPPCGDDDEYYLNMNTGSCYKFHLETRDWDDANSACTAEGGYLAIINDEQEARVIRDMQESYVWVGLRDYNKNNVWMSVHGDSIDQLYNVWHDGHGPQSNLYCATVNSEAKLDDYTCSTKRQFICERDPLGS